MLATFDLEISCYLSLGDYLNKIGCVKIIKTLWSLSGDGGDTFLQRGGLSREGLVLTKGWSLERGTTSAYRGVVSLCTLGRPH